MHLFLAMVFAANASCDDAIDAKPIAVAATSTSAVITNDVLFISNCLLYYHNVILLTF
jgi:hypothetical protein